MVVATRGWGLCVLLSTLCGMLLSGSVRAQEPKQPGEQAALIAAEAEYWEISRPAVPEGEVLEVGGIAFLGDGRPIISTRRGEIWVGSCKLDDAKQSLTWTRFAEGLQEPLGLLVEGEWVHCVQRGELSRLRDVDGDDIADELETLCDDWPLSGNYHEYAFGPRRGPEGDFWITLNKPFGDEPFGRADWRGFAVRIDKAGRMIPVACGLRSPAGIERSPSGDMFFTDNQGEWCGASKLSHIEAGDFHGHPWGVFSCHRKEWPYGHPGEVPKSRPMPRVRELIPSFKMPAVWFPYDKMGRSPSGLAWDLTKGRFGPFGGQLFVGDQHHSAVFRVCLERVKGHWQGACFPFRYGFSCGLVRVAFAPDGSLLVGESNRGWPSRGRETAGLERLKWTGKTPFEIHEMRARPDGFELTFTKPVDPASGTRTSSYRMESYTYLLHKDYGSPEVERAQPEITAARLGPGGRSVFLEVSGLRAGYVHELHLDGVRDAKGHRLLHPEAYYTLVEIPEAESGVALPEGFASLFDGETTRQWHQPYDWGEVSVTAGEIRLRGRRKFFLVSREEYEDFEFVGEVHVPVGGNSGIQFRSAYSRNRVWGYQAEVDTSERRWAGGLYDEGRRGWVAPVKELAARRAFRAGAWNHYRIRAVGDHLRVWVNDRLVTDVHDPVALRGHLALQHHGEAGLEYRFRNLGVRRLGGHAWRKVSLEPGMREGAGGVEGTMAFTAGLERGLFRMPRQAKALRAKVRGRGARGGILVLARHGVGGVVTEGVRATFDAAVNEAWVEDVGRGRTYGGVALKKRASPSAWRSLVVSRDGERVVMHVDDKRIVDVEIEGAAKSSAEEWAGFEAFVNEGERLEIRDLEVLVPANAPTEGQQSAEGR